MAAVSIHVQLCLDTVPLQSGVDQQGEVRAMGNVVDIIHPVVSQLTAVTE